MECAWRRTEFIAAGVFSSAGGKPSTNIALWHIPHALAVNRAGDQVAMSWPATGSNFVLEAARSLPATNWTAVATPPQVISDTLTVTEPASAPHQFFRLRRK